MSNGNFPKSVTQQRLSAHDAELAQLAGELGRSNKASQELSRMLREAKEEQRQEMEALEGQGRETREICEVNRSMIDANMEQCETLNKAYVALSSVLDDEVGRLKNEHGSDIQKLTSTTNDVQRSSQHVNERVKELSTEIDNLRSRHEDNMDRVKGQMRQNRIEIDDSRRQINIVGDLQVAMVELNNNQKEIASTVGGLQQSSIYISEWVQTLKSEVTELRALVVQTREQQARSSQALASDVAVLADEVVGLRTKLGHQDAEMCEAREKLGGKIESVVTMVTRTVETERSEVHQTLESVKAALKKQNDQNQQILQAMHAGQQRIGAQVTENARVHEDKQRFLEQAICKVESSLNLKTSEMSRGLKDHVQSIKRQLDANDHAVRMVTELMQTTLAGNTINHDFS